MQLSTFFSVKFHWWKKPEHPEKITDLWQVTDKLYHVKVISSSPCHDPSYNAIFKGKYFTLNSLSYHW